MASVVNDPNGRKRILFVGGRRRESQGDPPGQIDRKSANAIARHVEALLTAKIGGQPIPRDTAAWLAIIGSKLRDKLAAVGLVEALQRLTVREFLTGWAGANMRTTFAKIVRRAGVEPWPRLWHSLRASCESDQAQSFPLATVTKWLGNTPSVALRHYIDPTEAAFNRALEWRPEGGAKTGAPAAQKAAQRVDARNSGDSHELPQPRDCQNSAPLRAIPGDDEQFKGRECIGIEPTGSFVQTPHWF